MFAEHPSPRQELDALFAPASLAVIGVSDKQGNLPLKLIENLLAMDYPGSIHPVSARLPTIAGLATASGIDKLRGIDLAVIALPANVVPQTVLACGEQAIPAALVLSSGFAEVGNTGLQQELLDAAQTTGMRVCGPNCPGFLNRTDRVNANFADWSSGPGPIAIVSQSGGFGTFIERRMESAGLGCNLLISTGNEVDVSVASAIDYALQRSDISVVLGFAETIKDGERFVIAAERARALDKPLIILKSGRAEASQQAAFSHTASIAGSAAAFDAVCNQYGVHIATTVDDLIDLASVFGKRRNALGNRVGVLTPSGGAGVVLTDAVELTGLTVPALPSAERAQMAKFLPADFLGSLRNPVDLSMQRAIIENPFEKLLGMMAESSVVDMLAPVVYHTGSQLVEAARTIYRSTEKPMVVLSTGIFPEAASSDPPVFTDPRRVALALAAIARQSDSASQSRSFSAGTSVRGAESKSFDAVRAVLHANSLRPFMLEADSLRVLRALGIPVAPSEFVTTPEDAGRAFERLGGGAVVVKLMSYQIPHKTDFGAVRLNLATSEEVVTASNDMLARVVTLLPDVEVEGFLVQAMVSGRLELSCGLHRDPTFGPMVLIGVGGAMVEVIAEIAMLRAPFDRQSGRDAMASVLGGRLVSGPRSLSPLEVENVCDVACALGEFGLLCQEVESVDINPLRVAEGQVVAADALIVVKPEL